MTLRRSVLLATVLTALSASAASGDEIAPPSAPPAREAEAPAVPEPAPMAAPLPEVEPSDPAAFDDAIREWNRERSWSYGRQHFFQLTRELWASELPGSVRWPLAALTVPLDAGLLPIAVLAGFFGS